MTFPRGIIFTLSICLGVSGCREEGSDGPLPDPVGHAVDVHAKPWSADLAPDAKIVEVPEPPPAQREQAVADGSNSAFVAGNADAAGEDDQIEHVFFVSAGRCFRVDGLPLPQRPFNGLAWASSRYLVFDRWSQPHYGVHYVVDMQQRRVVHTAPFPDQFYLDQQRGAQSLGADGR